MVMENRPVDPGSIQGSHRPISFIRIKHRTRANDILCKTEYYLSYHTFSPQKPYYTNMSDVPRSLQSWVSTIHTVVLTADVFQLFIKTSFLAVLERCTKSFFLFFSVPCPEGRFGFSSEPATVRTTMYQVHTSSINSWYVLNFTSY